MDMFLLNKKLILLPIRNLKILCMCRFLYSYLMNNFFFLEKKYFIRNLNYSDIIDYQRYLYNNEIKDNFIFLKKKKNMSNTNSKKNVEEKINVRITSDENGNEIRSDKNRNNKIENNEIDKDEIDKDEINKEIIINEKIKKYKIINNELQDDIFSNNEAEKNYCLLNKEKVLNSLNYKNFTHYNFDPSLKAKKIQIYYNCEMYDMERKIKKIKNLLSSGYPVDILLIYNTDNSINKNLKKNKKFKEDENENNRNFEINKIKRFVETQEMKQTKYSLHVYIKINLILNHLKSISTVDQIFRHFKNRNHIILIKTYPK
ncbi:translation initiation factor IF-3, putative [Plasmodium relictum]|uniref:Translation initiation factor IF-3, putative n=1 Tax=Plasmodium relictum TaxID=85471 RepID=A0A1J1H2R3_PLARL|nr:translation initiation factor IF-3, putative [Plasmodium relictum]CRG99209.1 translation initiation factor IF-3, putative [Plasmodium relictum]